MDPFLANAEQILETASICAQPGEPSGAWTFLLGAGGEVQILAAEGWDLEALRRERGAAMAFRVVKGRGFVAVEGRARARTCRLERQTPAGLARGILYSRNGVRFDCGNMAARPALTLLPA